MKDHFIFGIENKDIQDHLLGETSESDNTVKALYEARKIESKLIQRKMLGIVNPSLVSIDAIKQKGKNSQFYSDYKFCGRSHNKGECPTFGKLCNACDGKNHFKAKCTGKRRKDQSHKSRFSHKTRKCDKCGHFGKKVNSVECDHESNTELEDLTDQVLSLFYH